MRALFPACLAVLLTTSAFAASPSCPEVTDAPARLAQWSGYVKYVGEPEDWAALKLRPLGAIESRDVASAILSAQKLYGLDAPSATGLLRGLLWNAEAGRAKSNPEAAAACLELATTQSHGNLITLLAITQLYPDSRPAREALRDGLAAAPEPAQSALRLLSSGLVQSWRYPLLVHFLSLHPESLPQALDVIPHNEWMTDVLLAAHERFRAEGRDDALAREVDERLVRGLLAANQFSLALAQFDSLSAGERDDFLQAHWHAFVLERRRASQPDGGSGWTSQKTVPDDARKSLLGAALLRGNAALANELRAALRRWPAPEADAPRRVALPHFDIADEVLAAAAGHVDSFGIWLHLTEVDDPLFSRSGPLLWSLLALPKLEPREHALLQKELAKSLGYLERPDRAEDWAPLATGFVDAAQERLATAWKHELELFRIEIGPAPKPEPAPRFNGSPVIERALASKPSAIFHERPAKECTDAVRGWSAVVDSPALPSGYHGVGGAEENGTQLVLARSQMLDPTGEVSGGAYWLLERKPARAGWKPIYLGLREYQPFEIPVGSVPAVRRGTLYLLTNVRKLDEKSITFPPVGLRTKEKRDGVCLAAKLADLERDSDRDGLSDLVEQRLMLDPHRADSDGDGMKDAVDPVPHVPALARKPPEAELIEALLAHLLTSGRPAPLIEGVHPGRPARWMLSGADFEKGISIVYLMTDPSLLRGADLPMRVIPLSDDEAKRAKERFGAFFPMRLDITVSGKHDRALIDWSEGWRGGTFEANRANGKWELVSISDWIT